MKPYSKDLRLRVLRDSEDGLESDEVAEKYGVSRSWVDRVKQRKREYGETEPRKSGGRKPVVSVHAARLRDLLQQRPDLTLREIRDELRLSVSLPAICVALKKLGYTFKKNPASIRTRSS